jgi:DNA-binding CsgD family transcriptional regulator/energy-coupling factor transporter ATP-binding protein EcfA2
MLTRVRTTWPLGGRDEAVAHVGALVRRGRGVLLAGPSGVGKTSLASLVGGDLESAGWTVVRVVASRTAATIPFGALAPLLTPGAALGDGTPALVQARAGIASLAAGRPSLVVVDDAQWLDEASAVVLHQLVAQRDLTLLATSRTDEPAPEPVTALWKDGLVDRVDVAPLDDESVCDLLESALDGPVETLTATRLWRRCSGNALYFRELVDEAARLDVFQRRDGLWCIDRLPPGSPRLAELVAQRLGALDAHERAALELIAVGEPIRLDMLDELVERDTVERLEAAGVAAIVRHGDRVVARPAHPLYGDVVRSSLPDLRRRRLTRSLADTLERQGVTGREDSIRLALWRLDGGGTAAPGLLLAAARHAHLAFDGATAERLAHAAWSADRTFEATHVLADVLFARGRYVEQGKLLAGMAGIVTTDEQRVVVAVSRALGTFWGLADGEAAERILVEAEAEVTDPEWWSELRATRATLVGQSGRHREVLALLADVPVTTMSGRARLQAGLAEAFALPGVGRGEEALTRIDEAMSAGAQVGPQLTLFRAGLLLSAKAMALVSLGRLDDAAEAARAGQEAAIATGNRAAAGFFGATLGWVQLHQGLLVSAQRTYRESATAFRASSHRGPLRWALGGLLFAAALARDREVATEAGRTLDSLGAHPAALFDTAISRARAWEVVAAGDPERARLLLRDAADEARSRGAVLDEAAALHDLVRLGRAREVAERLGRLAEVGQGAFLRILADNAAAHAHGDPSALGDAAERFAVAGFNLRAAESAMAASEASARAHAQRSAARWARRATELAARCEAPATVELQGRAGPVPLTNREREIAQLAADGLPSRVIAERLYVSVRTVDNHLGRIYTKLGVAGRSDLRDILRAADR